MNDDVARIVGEWVYEDALERWARLAPTGGARAAIVVVDSGGRAKWRTWSPESVASDGTYASTAHGWAEDQEAARTAADASLAELGWSLPVASQADVDALLALLDDLP